MENQCQRYKELATKSVNIISSLTKKIKEQEKENKDLKVQLRNESKEKDVLYGEIKNLRKEREEWEQKYNALLKSLKGEKKYKGENENNN